MLPGADAPEPEKKPDNSLNISPIAEKKVDVEGDLAKLDGLLEKVNSEEKGKVDLPPIDKKPEPKAEPKPVPAFAKEERRVMSETMAQARPVTETRVNSSAVAEETSVITAGTVLTGDIASDGSFDIQGTINGNVTCNGKLVVTGAINGNSAASEIFADVAKIEGEVVSSGTVKIGAGSVIIGNISASSAVIAGAIKGDIDVQGPVVVDTSAVIMGNIKSRSVQINNGAVIEGFCSQCYAEIDVEGLFDGR
jgi:cytoskeletal protein CcmA (bactofilin family)